MYIIDLICFFFLFFFSFYTYEEGTWIRKPRRTHKSTVQGKEGDCWVWLFHYQLKEGVGRSYKQRDLDWAAKNDPQQRTTHYFHLFKNTKQSGACIFTISVMLKHVYIITIWGGFLSATIWGSCHHIWELGCFNLALEWYSSNLELAHSVCFSSQFWDQFKIILVIRLKCLKSLFQNDAIRSVIFMLQINLRGCEKLMPQINIT